MVGRRTGCRCLRAQTRRGWRRGPASGSRADRPVAAIDHARRRRAAMSGTKSLSALASSGLISPILSGRAGRCGPSAQTIGAPVSALSLAASGEWSRWVWLTKMWLTGRPPIACEQRGKMRLVVGAGIDHRQPVAADDIAVGAVEGERAGIVRRHAHARRARSRPAVPCDGSKCVSNSSAMSVQTPLADASPKRVAA